MCSMYTSSISEFGRNVKKCPVLFLEYKNSIEVIYNLRLYDLVMINL